MNPDTPTGQSEQKTVLVIDDDALLRSAMTDKLTSAGYQTLQADGGQEGIDMALSHHPDLIISDYQMPDIDGVEVIKALRQDEWGKTVEVIFATNVYDATAVNAVLELGVHDYVLKADVSLEQIVELVRKYLPLT